MNNYVSYFQSAITIGIMTRAKNIAEARSKASERVKNSDGFINHCAFEQTPFELTGTDKLNPEFHEIEDDGNGIRFAFSPDEKTRNIIATRLSKPSNSLNSKDYEDFVKESIEMSLSKHKEIK